MSMTSVNNFPLSLQMQFLVSPRLRNVSIQFSVFDYYGMTRTVISGRNLSAKGSCLVLIIK